MESSQIETTTGKSRVKPTLILLDVYETLLDMSPIEKKVNALLDSKRGYAIWFELFMQYCFVDNCLSQFNDFTSVAKATLKMTGAILGEKVTDDDTGEVLHLLNHLPVKEGVPEGLSQLHDGGFRIAALTNSSQHIVEDRMEMTGLISYFEAVLSAEHVKKYKPALEVYQWAMHELNVVPEEVLVVSAHAWDVAGAANAGMQTVYLKEAGPIFYPLMPEPTLQSETLEKLVQQLKTYYNVTG